MLMPERRHKRNKRGRWALAGLLSLLILCLGCGAAVASPEPPLLGPPTGTYMLTVVGESGNIRSSVNLTLQIL
jgi:hypothetical protein